MAYLYYGAECTPIEIPEVLLAHVKIVITTKLRRSESFMLSWRHADDSGRSAIWVQPSIPLRFVFDAPDQPQIDRELLTQLADAANSNGGLTLTLTDDALAAERADAAPLAHQGAPAMALSAA